METPREMMERGDYINPIFNYEPRINKPVLSYWIVAGFYHLFGVSVGVERIPIALGGIVLIVTAFFLARAASPPGRVDRRGVVGGARPRRVAAAADVRAPHLHRHLHLDVHGADAAVLRAVGTLSGAAPAVSDPDVRLRRTWRSDEGTDRGAPARARVCGLSARAPRARPRARDAGAARDGDRARDRRPVVRGAVSAVGVGADQVLLLRGELRSLCGWCRRERRSPVLVVPAGRVHRLVPVVALPLSGSRAVAARAPPSRGRRRSALASRRCCGSGSRSSSAFSRSRRASRISTSIPSSRRLSRSPALSSRARSRRRPSTHRGSKSLRR